MIVLGLSGAAGSGKTTVAGLFRKVCKAGVFDADREVHKMYDNDAGIISAVEKYFPASIRDGKVSRKKLAKHFYAYSEEWKDFQRIVHKKLLWKQKRSIQDAMKAGVRYFVLDIPLLLEGGFGEACDVVVHVHVNKRTQWQRLVKRGLTEENIRFILSLQLDGNKRHNLADFTLNTGYRASEISMGILDILRSLPSRGMWVL
ncbi:dephospho-CoA kinase [Anaplasma platys]|nr:dephospho-CoA kinase [Anaplasma platys]